MELYFLRHGLAVEHGAPGYAKDADRPLLPEGIKKLRSSVKGMRTLELSFDRIYSSPYLRAKETAEIIAEGVDFKEKIIFTDTLLPGAGFKEFEKFLKEFKKEGRFLLVGHEPSMSGFISQLVSARGDVNLEMKKGGFCRVDVADQNHIIPGILKWLLTSRQLRTLG